MKPTVLVIMIAPILVACAAPAPPTLAPMPTLIAVPTFTATFTLTPTVTPIPSPTPRPKTGAADEWLGKADEREKLFNAYVQTIKDAQVFSELEFKRLGTTWEKELERAKKRFVEADTKADVYYALLSLQRTIHDMHSSLTVPSVLMPPSQTLSLPFTLGVRGNSLESAHYVVVPSAIPELKPGFVL